MLLAATPEAQLSKTTHPLQHGRALSSATSSYERLHSGALAEWRKLRQCRASAAGEKAEHLDKSATTSPILANARLRCRGEGLERERRRRASEKCAKEESGRPTESGGGAVPRPVVRGQSETSGKDARRNKEGEEKKPTHTRQRKPVRSFARVPEI